jgi:hypothetical protein
MSKVASITIRDADFAKSRFDAAGFILNAVSAALAYD